MTSFTPHPIRKRSARTGRWLRDDALELAVARNQTCAGEQTVAYSAGFGQRNEEIGASITFLPNCKFAESEHLSPPPVQENGAHGRAEDIRTIVGSWPSQGLAPHAVRIAAGSPAPKFRHFHISR